MRKWIWPGLIALALYLLAFALRFRLLGAPPYGDEPMHYWMARHLFEVPTVVSDQHGFGWVHPTFILWQRPLYYFSFHAFALFGFESFRVAQILVCSLMPVVGYALLRVYGASRAAAVAGGLFAAAYPLLVVWGTFGLMDEPMTLLVALALWARKRGNPVASALLLLGAVWVKETAYFVLVGLAAMSLWKGFLQGTNRFRAFQLDRPTASLLASVGLALFPLQVAFARGLGPPGASATGYGLSLVEGAFISPWLIPVLILGLLRPNTRGLAGFALFLGSLNVGLHVVAHRAIEIWYLVLPVFFVGMASCLMIDGLLRGAPGFAWPRRARIPLAAVGIAVLLSAILLPASGAKSLVTRPFTGDGESNLFESYAFELNHRDRNLLLAFDAVDFNVSRSVITVDLFYPHNLYPMAEKSRHVYVDSAGFRDLFPLRLEAFVHHAEENGTRLLVHKTDFPFYHAINEAYEDCRTYENEDYRVYETWRCQGRGARLEEAYRSRLGPPYH